MDEIILVGAGGHARACVEAMELISQLQVTGLVENEKKDKQNDKSVIQVIYL